MRWRTAKNHRRSADRKYQQRLAKARKSARLGLSYGMGLAKLREAFRRYSVSENEADKAVRQFRRNYKSLVKFHSAVRARGILS